MSGSENWIDAQGEAAVPLEGTLGQVIANQQLLHGLLVTLSEPKARHEQRLRDAFSRIDVQATGAEAVSPVANLSPATAQRSWRAAGWLAVAAALVLALVLADKPLSAEQGLSRVIEQLDRPLTYVYQVTVRMDRPAEDVERKATVYSRSVDRFVAVLDDAPVQPAIVGSTGDEQWIVFGERRWTSTEAFAGEALLAQRVATRQLHLHRLLKELPAGYDIAYSDRAAPEGEAARPLEATRRPGGRGRASRVVVWPDPVTGSAARVEAWFDPAGPRRVESLTAVLVGVEEKDDEFFTIEAHPGAPPLDQATPEDN